MFAGERINVTEDRAVLHTALRAPRGAPLVIDGRDVVADVRSELAERAASAIAAGIVRERIVLDPGIGFGKTVQQNFALGHAAMMINEGTPGYIVQRLERKYDLSELRVGILGLSFKGGEIIICSDAFLSKIYSSKFKKI